MRPRGPPRPRGARSRRRASRAEHNAAVRVDGRAATQAARGGPDEPEHGPSVSEAMRRGVRSPGRARSGSPRPVPSTRRPPVPDPIEGPRTLDTLADGVSAAVRGVDLDEGLGSLLAAAVAALGAQSAMVSLQDPDRPDPELTLTIGFDEAAQGAAVAAVTDPDHPLTTAGRDRAEARSGATIALPLIVTRAGVEEALGALAVTFANEAAADAADPVDLRLVADLAALAVDRAGLASTVAERSEWFERLAHTDPLTGLANLRTVSRVLELELARAGRQGNEVSVAVFDVDGFGAVNAASG